MLVGTATRLGLRREPQRALGLEVLIVAIDQL